MIRSNSVIANSNHGLAKNARNGGQKLHKTSSQFKTSLEKQLYDNAHKSLTQFVPNRKFGGYDGADEPVSEINFTKSFSRIPNGHLLPKSHAHDGRMTRCTDRFVQYVYPNNMRTKYAEQFEHKNKRTLI